MVNLVATPGRTPITFCCRGIRPAAGFVFVPAPEDATLEEGALAPALADTVAPSAVVTVTVVEWFPGEAAMPANTTDRDCFGSSGPITCV